MAARFPMARELSHWKLRTRTLPLGHRTLIMAIVNLTPDSFSGDGVLAPQNDPATNFPEATSRGIEAALAALDAGADLLDLGAESTRPGATPLSAGEEQDRLLPVLEGVLRARPDALVSVDTYHAATAWAAALSGAEIINDVSGLLWDAAMAETLHATRCGLVLMHTRGRPQDWRTQPRLAPHEVVSTVCTGLREQFAFAQAAGLPADSIVLDPGFGFGKLGRENFTLLAGLADLHQLGRPLLIGLSRKGFLAEPLTALQPADPTAAHLPAPTLPPQLRGNATLAAHTAAVLNGAHILRTHEVQPTREAAAIADALLSAHVP